MQVTATVLALVVFVLADTVIAQTKDEDRESSPTQDTIGEDEYVEEVVVVGDQPRTAASSQTIRAVDYALRPHSTTQEILNNVPGLVVVQHQGGGKATQYFIRGFDADHGTDFAVFFDGMPINLVTHAHGQGYADNNFIIPQTIERLELFKGPYFAELGDFDTGGALNIITRDEFDENFISAEGGSFSTQRYTIGASPRVSWAKTLIALEAYASDGPFDNPQDFTRFNSYGKLTFDGGEHSRLTVAGSVYAANWDGSGQVPLREVSNGSLDRFGAIDPREGGSTDREFLDIKYAYTPDPNQEWASHLWVNRYSLGLFSNFTFFQDTGNRFYRGPDGRIVDNCAGFSDPTLCPRPAEDYLPGDGIDQDDERIYFGGQSTYTRRWQGLRFPIESQIGVQTRHDDANVALHRQVERQRFFTITNVNVEETSVAGYMRHQITFAKWLRLEGGLRADVYFFDTRDRLPTQAPDANFEAVENGGDTTDSIVSPKVNLIATPIENTEVYLNFGTGFHSNDARAVVRGGDGLVQAIGYELGARTYLFDQIHLASALWLLDLDSELVFCGDCGDIESADGVFAPSDETRRWGIDFEARWQPLDWLYADYDLSFANPEFKDGGDPIPLAPTLVMNGGITAETDFGLSAALRVRYLDDRPANEDETLTARGWTLLDLVASYRWRNIEASLGLFNILDRDWREAQFASTSCVGSEVGANPSCPTTGNGEGIEDLHFTPGANFGARGGLTWFF